MDTKTVKSYCIEVFGEHMYEFNMKLTKEELFGVCKVLEKCNEIRTSDNDFFIVMDNDTMKDLVGFQ